MEIGNHSHSHEYLVNETPEIIKEDIIRANVNQIDITQDNNENEDITF